MAKSKRSYRKPHPQHERCFRFGHKFSDGTDPHWTPPFEMIGAVYVCDYCGAVRYDAIDSLGVVAVRRYDYPSGYSMRKDERPTRTELRAEWYERELKKQKARNKPKQERRLKAV